MKIKEIQGNLLKFPEGIQVIGHQANCECIMGSGIAAQIASQIPAMKDADDRFFIPKGGQRLGHASYAYFYDNRGDYSVKVGFNLYGQRLGGVGPNGERIERLSPYGIPTDYDALLGALYAMRSQLCRTHLFNILNDDEPVKIGFPKLMGCSLGGGDWNRVLYLIKTAFRNYNVEIYIVDFNEQ